MKKYTLTNPLFKRINNKLFQVIAEAPINIFNDVNGYRDYLKCDVVFKENKTEKYIFCREIEEAIIE
jgi:hypothetical protein